MSNVLIINAHQPYAFSEGKLNATLTDYANRTLAALGHTTRVVKISEGWDVNEQLALHQWADVVLLQSPVNWMGVTWSFKKYMDEVYSAGMGGELCAGDGRHRDTPTKNYGSGGSLQGKKYMLSLTFNAPEQAFNDPEEYLFQGRSVDDLWWPMHMNFRFFAMESLPTFACYDVMKNPTIEQDLQRYDAHLKSHF